MHELAVNLSELFLPRLRLTASPTSEISIRLAERTENQLAESERLFSVLPWLLSTYFAEEDIETKNKERHRCSEELKIKNCQRIFKTGKMNQGELTRLYGLRRGAI